MGGGGYFWSKSRTRGLCYREEGVQTSTELVDLRRDGRMDVAGGTFTVGTFPYRLYAEFNRVLGVRGTRKVDRR